MGLGKPKGGSPPTANPVAARASSGSARRTAEAPATVASRATSTRLAPLVSANRGSPSATNTSDFTICPTSQPIARAASGAVFVPSGNRRTSTGRPSTAAASRNRSIALLMRPTIPAAWAAGTIRPELVTLDRTRLLGIAHAERERLGRTIQYTPPAAWDAPSVCHGWRNRDIVAHLAAHDTAAAQLLAGDSAEEFDAFREANDGELWVNGFNEWAVEVREDVPTRQLITDWGKAAQVFLVLCSGLSGDGWASK